MPRGKDRKEQADDDGDDEGEKQHPAVEMNFIDAREIRGNVGEYDGDTGPGE